MYNLNISITKSQHGCVRWALRKHITPPCCDFACGGLENCHQIDINKPKLKKEDLFKTECMVIIIPVKYVK